MARSSSGVRASSEQRGRRTFCDHFIEFEDWTGTFCKLETGHDGDHSAHYPQDPLMLRAVLAAGRAYRGAVQ